MIFGKLHLWDVGLAFLYVVKASNNDIFGFVGIS